MKKYGWGILLAAMLTLCVGAAYADGTAGLQYRLDQASGAAIVTGYSGTEEAVVIPSQYFDSTYLSTYSVTEIADFAFFGSSLKYLITPSTLTGIGTGAFYGCESLETVDLSASHVTVLGTDVFSGCASLRSIELPLQITAIGNRAFEGCASLSRITLPKNIQTIGADCFAGCASLTSATVLNSGAQIGANAFQNTASGFAISVNEFGVDGIPSYNPFEPVPEDMTAVVRYAADNKIRVVYLKGVPGSVVDNIPLPEEIRLGETLNLAQYLGTGIQITSIQSTNTSVLSVDETAQTLTGLTQGTSTLTVTYTGGTSTAQVTVYKPVTSFTISPNPKILIEGTTVTLSLENIQPADGYQKYSWALDSGAAGIVMIKAANNTACDITALVEGEANITCTNVSGAKATCKVIVVGQTYFENLTACNISPAFAEGYIGTPLQFTAQLQDNSGNLVPLSDAAKVVFTSSDSSIAAVSESGDAVPMNPGKVTITAHAQSQNGNFDTSSAVATVIVHSPTILTMPAMLTEIEEQAFYGSPAVEVRVGGGVTSIGREAFAQCASLKLVLIENGSCAIDDLAFSGSTGVTIVCPKGSNVETWANQNNVPCVPVTSFN